MPSSTRTRRRPHVVAVMAFDGVQSLDVSGPWEVFAGVNSACRRGGAPDAYALRLLSLTGGAVVTESGLTLTTEPVAAVTAADTVLVPGGSGVLAAAGDARFVAAVHRLQRRADRVVSVCSGAFVLAAAGLADGKRVTTHWARAARLQRQHPGVTVDADPIYIRDGRVWSSAGVTAGIDLALALVEHDHGAETAQEIARWLVMFLRRPGGQTQFAAPVWNERATTPPVRRAQELIEAAPGDDHRLDLLAAKVGISPRHLSRCFAAETGASPGRYVTAVRIEAARRALETSADTVATIASAVGFGSAETMRRTFAEQLGVSPDQYRQRFRRSS